MSAKTGSQAGCCPSYGDLDSDRQTFPDNAHIRSRKNAAVPDQLDRCGGIVYFGRICIRSRLRLQAFFRQLFTALLRITVHLFLVPSRTELISAPSMTRYMQMYSQNIPMARVVRLPYMENPL